MESRVETLLNALVNGETIDFNPQSRIEEYLKNCINKTGTEGLPAPQSRIDALLYKLAEVVASGGGGGGVDTLVEFLKVRDGIKLFYNRSDMSQDSFEKLFPISAINTAKFTTIESMFELCSKLTLIPYFDTSNVSIFTSAFASCSKLKSIPKIDTRKGIYFDRTFLGCSVITTIHELDLRNASNCTSMFASCSAITTIPELDLRNAESTSNIVYACKKLASIRFKNLTVSTTIASGTTYGHLIVVEDLIFMIYHLRDTGSSKTFTIGIENLSKLANVYVKTISITDEMRAEDDLIDEKLPFEVCESTDEGAMLIEEYTLLKNWTLK